MSDEPEAQLDYKVELPEFEGPLDLLLHLVKKHELDILDIPIAFITDRYLQMLDVMRSLNLDVAGEYLLMAATLAHLKSRELVPPDPAEDALLAAEEEGEELDPRQELIRRLLEYQKFKDAGDKLAGRPVTGRNVWPRGASAEDVAGLHALPGGAPLAEVPVFRLIESLERVLSRAKVTFTHDVVTDRISITDKINELVDRLEREGSFSFESCFAFSRRSRIASCARSSIFRQSATQTRKSASSDCSPSAIAGKRDSSIRSTWIWIKLSRRASLLPVLGFHAVSLPSPSRVTLKIGCATSCTFRLCAVISPITESSRNGMSSFAISMTVMRSSGFFPAGAGLESGEPNIFPPGCVLV